MYCSWYFHCKNVTEYGVEKDKPVTVQLFQHTIRASLIFCAKGQSLLVQVQCSGDVAVLCLRSDLVLLQDAALQHVAVSAWGDTCLSMAAPPLHIVRMDQISLFAT